MTTKGCPPHLVQLLQELRDIDAEVAVGDWNIDDVRSRVQGLRREDLLELFGPQLSLRDLIGLSHGDVKAVVDDLAALNEHQVVSSSASDVRPVPPTKLEFNRLSRATREFLQLGAQNGPPGCFGADQAELQRLRFRRRCSDYSDLQSLHSEDAITWSVFGPVIYADAGAREAFVRDLLENIGIPALPMNARIWLWRRLPHPDTLVPGGPEIDFGIQTDDAFVLGEARWRSSVGAAQGVNRDKDQMTLRREVCEKYGRRLLPTVKHFGVLGVSWTGGITAAADANSDGVSLYVRDATWDAISTLPSHPCQDELLQYLEWKIRHSKSD